MAPGTEAFAQEYADQPFAIYALDLWDGSAAICESFRQETGITYPILMMAGSAGVGTDYDCIQTSFFVVDGQGYIRYRRTNAEGGMPAFIPEEVRPVVDLALSELQTSGVEETPAAFFVLEAAYPNPFNPSTTIPYSLAEGPGTTEVLLQVLDLRGRLVRTLVSGHHEKGKNYSVVWYGRNQNGNPMPSGVYMTSLRVGGESRSRLISLVQ